MSNVDSSSNKINKLFPLGIKIESVLGLLKALNDVFNKHADIFALANYFDLEADDLLPVLDVIELLEFALIQGGDVIITPQGEKFLKSSSSVKRQILRDKLKNFEPFKTAISILSKSNELKVEDVAKELENMGYSEVNEFGFDEKLSQTLIEWGVYAGILIYSSENQVFKLNKKHIKV